MQNSQLTETQSYKIIQCIQSQQVFTNCLQGVISDDHRVVQRSLNSLSTIIDNMKDSLSKMHRE